MSTLEFDLRRINTVVSPTGKVHIELIAGNGTLCGQKGRSRFLWTENFDDRQPDCQRCVLGASKYSVKFPYVRRVMVEQVR